MNELRAYIWWCGDEWCDCTQPVIDRVQGQRRGPVRTDRVWSGTFHSGATAEESAEQERELAEARERYGVPAS